MDLHRFTHTQELEIWFVGMVGQLLPNHSIRINFSLPTGYLLPIVNCKWHIHLVDQRVENPHGTIG
jgi:hypothetical protein